MQNYFHQVWVDDLENKDQINDLARGLFDAPNAPAMQAMAQSLHAANEAYRQTAAEKRGVKTSTKNVIRRAHKPQP